MAIRDVKLSGHIDRAITSKKNSLPVDLLAGLSKGLKEKYSLENVTGSLLGGGNIANNLAKRMFGEKEKKEKNQSGSKVSKLQDLITKSDETQSTYLMSIDSTLKEIQASFDLLFDKQRESNYESKLGKKGTLSSLFGRKNDGDKKDSGGPGIGGLLGLSALASMLSKLPISKILKLGAGIAGAVSAGFDAKAGMEKSSQWGVSKASGGVGAFLGGMESGMGNAVKKALELGAMGTLIAGPIGGIVGAILGAIAGYFGGEATAKFIDEAFEKSRAIYTDTLDAIYTNLAKGLMKLKEVGEDLYHMVFDFGTDFQTTVGGIFMNMLAGVQERFGGMASTIGRLLGIDKLKNFGDEQVAAGTAKRDSAEQNRIDRDQSISERESGKLKERNQAREVFEIKDPNSNVYSKPAPPPPKQISSASATSTSPTPNKAKGAIIQSDLTVGEVPGDAIKAAADFASKMGDASITVPPEALAAIVAKESGGKLSVGAGDKGASVGITQMKQVALDDVNMTYGTQFSQEMVKNNYEAALQAAALFLKLQLQRKKGNLSKAIAGYNGSGPMAENYSADAMGKINNFKMASAPAVSITPTPKTTGQSLASLSTENAAMAATQTQATSGQPIVVNTNNNVNNNQTIAAPIPNTRNDDLALSRVLGENWFS